ncbi:MAG: DUF4159 domain-containing protein [Rhodospirillales bacterium]|nr:DUF4159 domain-containing protein [Rhodospirillales bacterium]MCB9995460.1 DUF4159 domain-containing protein [Rhodospirillales bacterium]
MRDIFRTLARKSGLASAFLAAVLTGAAVSMPAVAADPVGLVDEVTRTRLGYVRTGNGALDNMTEAGLRGLGIMLYERTGVQDLVTLPARENWEERKYLAPVEPAAADLEGDRLGLFPMIYWTIDPAQSIPSDKAIQNLNSYMRNGGMLVFDTREKSTTGRGAAWLQRLVDRGLEIGPIAEARGCVKKEEPCHVLGKSFYLMEAFPGRYDGGKLWVQENPDQDKDRVSSVVIGGNEWAAAWATDEYGQYLYAVVGDEEQREHAFRFGVNLVMYALTGNYKADLIHAPAILKRTGPH